MDYLSPLLLTSYATVPDEYVTNEYAPENCYLTPLITNFYEIFSNYFLKQCCFHQNSSKISCSKLDTPIRRWRLALTLYFLQDYEKVRERSLNLINHCH